MTKKKSKRSPRYFVPSSQLFDLTIGKKYLIKYTNKGREIVDDRGVKRIIKPLRSEIEVELQFEDLKIGQHLWALHDNKLIVAAKFDESGYQVCGPWECGIGKNECEIIELIDVPKGHENTSLYYAD